jgi:transcription antitermination protein NusB
VNGPVADELAQGTPGSRRSARREAVFVLYQHDVTGLPLDDLAANVERQGSGPLDRFSLTLIEGVSAHREELDERITAAAAGWTAERLAPLERNILRVAIHELTDEEGVPPPVAIDEAVRMAKRYCQPEAAALVNGILGRIAEETGGGR